MTDESNTGAPRGPLFVALDLHDRIPAVRDACTELGVQLAGVDLSNGTRLAINLGDALDAGGFACVEHDSALELRMSVEAHCRVDKVPAPARVVLAHLRAGLRSLDVLLDPPGEVVDAEFEEQPAGESPSFTGAVVARAPIEVNLNDTITVRLTDRGREILAARIESEQRAIPEYLRGINPPANRRPDADGYLSTTIWDFANVFGCFLSMGAREPVAMTATIRPREIAQEVVRLHAELEAARRELEQTKAALQGARDGRDAAWDALTGLARRLDVAFDTTASPGELADLIFEASQRRREQREINDLAARLDEVRAALDLDADTYFGPVMARLRQVVEIASIAQGEMGFTDFEGVAEALAAGMASARTTGLQYDELAQALGCGLPADHANVRSKLDGLKRREAAADSALQKLRTWLDLQPNASPEAIADLAFSTLSRAKTADGMRDALRILGCPEHVADVVGWAKLQAQQKPAEHDESMRRRRHLERYVAQFGGRNVADWTDEQLEAGLDAIEISRGIGQRWPLTPGQVGAEFSRLSRLLGPEKVAQVWAGELIAPK